MSAILAVRPPFFLTANRPNFCYGDSRYPGPFACRAVAASSPLCASYTR